jgi:excisionase family DNA binding protein
MRSEPVSILDDPALRSSRVITVAEATAMLHCRTTKLYDLLGSGAVRSYKDGGSRRIYLHSVLQYMDAQAARGPALGISPNPKARARMKAAGR